MYNVLIADDDVDAWFQVNALLRRYLIKANFVNNLSAARHYIDKHVPSLLFFEKQLQDNSVLDFIKYVRTKYPSAKIVMIASHTEEPLNFRWKADLVINKPLVPEMIERAIVNLLAGFPQPLQTARLR